MDENAKKEGVDEPEANHGPGAFNSEQDADDNDTSNSSVDESPDENNSGNGDGENVSNRSSSSRGIFIWMIVAVAVLVVLVVTFIILFILNRTEDEQVEIPVFATMPAEDAVWQEIQSRGRLIVGTAADYPPFEYYDQNFQLDGLDIALIEEIGQRLGLDVELRDMAFDGLGNAIMVNQIDIAISAISATKERQQYVDFSNVYFVSRDAVLANADSPINEIASAEEVAGLKVGVERGTVYDNFVQTSLVESGLMPPENAHAYLRIDDALDDLVNGRIDLVALDLQPAQLAESQGGVKIVAEGLTPQQFAIALPKGAIGLRDQLNRVLFDMQNDGSLRQLTADYIGVTEEAIPPLPEPLPTSDSPPALPPGGCIDSAQFEAHLNYDHQDFEGIPQLNPGETFQKGWQISNTGTCTWNQGYALIPVGGNNPAARMGGLPVVVETEVPEGQSYDFTADLIAPIEPGTYVQYWSMRNNQSGLLFGDRVSVAVEIVAAATPTPLPTQTPVPGIRFSVDPEIIEQGQCSTLTWAVENVQSAYLYEQGEDWQQNGVPDRGSLAVCPLTTSTYELRVVLNDGSVEIRQATIYVIPNPAVPQITRFTVDPSDQIALGQCVTVQWLVEGAVNTVNIFRNNVVIWPNAPISSALQDCPPSSGQQIYIIEVTGPGGTSQGQWPINVVGSGTPVPTSTPTVAPQTPTPGYEPVIYFFLVTPAQIRVDQCVTLSWSVGGNTSRVSIIKNSVTVQENLAFNSSWNDCGNSNVGTAIYSIVASSPFNQTVTQQQTINILP